MQRRADRERIAAGAIALVLASETLDSRFGLLASPRLLGAIRMTAHERAMTATAGEAGRARFAVVGPLCFGASQMVRYTARPVGRWARILYAVCAVRDMLCARGGDARPQIICVHRFGNRI